MGRTPCCDKANVKKGPWSSEEDAKLKAYMEENATGGNWITLPQKIGLKRCGKSCRLRWLNYLRPNIKHGGFSEEEDNIICNLYISIGSRWSIIASQLPGRTDNDIKNYWNTKLKKKLLGRRKQSHRASMQDPRDLKSDGEEGCSQALTSPSQDRLLPMQPHCFENPSPFPSTSRVWPNLLPIQETTTNHSLQCNDYTNQGWIKAPLVPQHVSPSPPLPIPPVMLTQNVNLYDIDRLQVLEMDDLENNLNGIWFNKAVDSCGEHVCVEAVQPKLEDLVTNHMAVDDISAQQDHHMAEFDPYSNGMMNEWNSDSINVWGCNEFGSISSSSSWDSISPGLSESDEGMMFQDYMLSYNML